MFWRLSDLVWQLSAHNRRLYRLLGTFLCHFADEARTNRAFLSSKSSKRVPTGGITTVFLNGYAPLDMVSRQV